MLSKDKLKSRSITIYKLRRYQDILATNLKLINKEVRSLAMTSLNNSQKKRLKNIEKYLKEIE